MEKFKFLAKDKLSQLPKVPGVYAFKKGRKILYIGKATNLKERIKQHKDLLGLATKLGYIKTGSTIEALILEANLIKKYKPKYNVIWRDDKNYFFVGITKEDFPRIFITHQPLREVRSKKYKETKKRIFKSSDFRLQTSYVGPFVDGGALKQTLKILRKIFPYRSCKKLPNHPCLWYQLGKCPAPCQIHPVKSSPSEVFAEGEQFNRVKKESQENVKNIIKILQGEKSQVITILKKEMKEAALIQDFERAAKNRDKIRDLEKILAHANPALSFFNEERKQKDWFERAGQKALQKTLKIKKEISRIEAYDISNIQGKESTGAMIVFTNGKPEKNQYRKFKIRKEGSPNDTAMIKEVLKRRLKHRDWSYPTLILIDGGKAQLNAALQCLKHKFREIRVMALAKKKNELFIDGQKLPILLENLPREIFNLILQIRDEAHRFAISYHRKLRKKKLIGS